MINRVKRIVKPFFCTRIIHILPSEIKCILYVAVRSHYGCQLTAVCILDWDVVVGHYHSFAALRASVSLWLQKTLESKHLTGI